MKQTKHRLYSAELKHNFECESNEAPSHNPLKYQRKLHAWIPMKSRSTRENEKRSAPPHFVWDTRVWQVCYEPQFARLKEDVLSCIPLCFSYYLKKIEAQPRERA